jgi:putative hydrolase of the HAD superfamily
MTAPKAFLLDVLGTLVRLESPAPLLLAALARRGIQISDREARDAIAAEIGFYRANLQMGRDRPSVDLLRARCAGVLVDALPPAARHIADPTAVLAESLSFRAFPEVAAVLRDLRRSGVRLVAVSNWDSSLHDVLAELALADLLDGVVTSAEHGMAKPDPSIFAAALEIAGTTPAETIHVGDDLTADYTGARSAGIRAILLVRGRRRAPEGVESIRSLAELPRVSAA